MYSFSVLFISSFFIFKNYQKKKNGTFLEHNIQLIFQQKPGTLIGNYSFKI